MDLKISRRILAVASIPLAVWLGWKVANGELLLPGVALAITTPLLIGYLTGIAPDVLIAGALLLGYLVGNRGFAQISVPGIPLLPGEVALGTGLAIAAWRAAGTKTLFIQRDVLNAVLVVWIALCSVRLPQDVRLHGLAAVRDFAFVYYALFFFLAQGWSRLPGARRYLEFCLSLGFALVPPVTGAFTFWPEIITKLSVAGVPLIFVKGDVAGAFMAAGVFWFSARHARDRTWTSVVLATLCVAGVTLSNSRAAIVALLLGATGVVALRERHVVRMLLGISALGVALLALEAGWSESTGRASRAFRLFESLRTVTDFSGTRTPVTADLGDKPDNNRFRLVWWQAVIEQTRQENPWLGLGFGYDLADEFLRRYYGDNEDFNVRSPHNVLITVFARTGLIGLLSFLSLLVAFWLRTWRAAREQQDAGIGAAWIVPAAIFIAACFGVVLEGPMGAVVFWTTLGLANSQLNPDPSISAPESANSPLAAPTTSRELMPTP